MPSRKKKNKGSTGRKTATKAVNEEERDQITTQFADEQAEY